MRTAEMVEVDMLAGMLWDLLRMKAREDPEAADHLKSDAAISDCIEALRAFGLRS
jgi:hypothetical protein